MKLFNFFATTALLVEANKVRSPEERQNKNELFLKKWFGNNCKGEDYRGQDDAVRPFRCQNKLDRYMIEWEKLQRHFAECGHFDLEAAVTGKNKGARKRRSDDQDNDYESDWADYHNQGGDVGLFDNDLWEMTDEELAAIEAQDQNDGNNSTDENDDYVSIDKPGTQISECTRKRVFIFVLQFSPYQSSLLFYHFTFVWSGCGAFETKKKKIEQIIITRPLPLGKTQNQRCTRDSITRG